MLIEPIHRGDPAVHFYSHDFVFYLVCYPLMKLSWNNIAKMGSSSNLTPNV